MNDRADTPLAAVSLDDLRRRHSVKWRQYPTDVLPLFVAEMDTPPAPAVAEALNRAVADGDTGYATAAGLPEAFAGFSAERFGWQVDPMDVTVVPDVMSAVRAALTANTEPGDAVVLSTPVYPPFFAAVSGSGRRVVDSPMVMTTDGYRFDFDRLARDFAAGARAYLLCNPHNPLGRVYTRQELATVAELAERHDVLVISDEIHAPLTMPGHRHIPFASLDTEAAARGYTMMSASKAWNLAGLKTAVMVTGSRATTDRFPSEMTAGAGLLGVLASRAAYRDGVGWLDALLSDLDHRRRLLTDLVNTRLPGVGYRPPEGTYLSWLDLRALDLPADPAEVLLDRARVAVVSGAAFGPAGAGFVRLNTATSSTILTEAVDRIAEAVCLKGS